MINLKNDPASIAKAQVDKWFGTTAQGPVFLTRDARAYRLSADELNRLRDDAEAEVTSGQIRMRFRTYLALFLVVITFVGMTMLAAKVAAPWDGIIKATGYGLYAAHGVWILYEAFKYDREVKAVRDKIAAALTTRVPLPASMTEQMTRTNPFQVIMVTCVALLLVVYFLAENLAHRGIDIISMIPAWAYLGFVPLVWGLYFLAHVFDRRRGVGS
jgi:hypothetical protein